MPNLEIQQCSPTSPYSSDQTILICANKEGTNATFENIVLSAPKTGKLGMQFINLTNGTEPMYLKVEGGVVFEPSVYNGTGEETRKWVALELSERDANTLAALEIRIRTYAGIPVSKWNFCVTNSRLKAKINMSGINPCEFVGPHEETMPPDSLRGREVVAVIAIRGIYQQKKASGLMIDVVALRYGDFFESKKGPSFLDMLK